MTEDLKGADFVAVVAIYDKPGRVLAALGETCERVPQASLGWLAVDGLIRRGAPAVESASVRKRRAAQEGA